MQTTPATYTAEEAARLLGIGVQKVYLAIRKGELPGLRIGKSYLIPRIPLDRLLSGETIQPRVAVRSSLLADGD